MDTWLVLAYQAFGWPPSVTRQQSFRDLQLLFASRGGG